MLKYVQSFEDLQSVIAQQRLTKNDLIKYAFDNPNKIDTGIPVEYWKLKNSYYLVMDYTNNIFGEIVNVAEIIINKNRQNGK